MRNTQEKSLISQKNIGIFARIINFFKNMLKKEEKIEVQAESNKDWLKIKKNLWNQYEIPKMRKQDY